MSASLTATPPQFARENLLKIARSLPADVSVLAKLGTLLQDPNSERIWFNGITEAQAHARFTLGGSVTYQAGEFVKFNAGGSYTWVQSYLITGADACNPIDRKEPSTAGPCHSAVNGGVGPQPITGIPNPYHRPLIDLPGRSQSVDAAELVGMALPAEGA